jgi:hypothetical protein
VARFLFFFNLTGWGLVRSQRRGGFLSLVGEDKFGLERPLPAVTRNMTFIEPYRPLTFICIKKTVLGLHFILIRPGRRKLTRKRLYAVVVLIQPTHRALTKSQNHGLLMDD